MSLFRLFLRNIFGRLSKAAASFTGSKYTKKLPQILISLTNFSLAQPFQPLHTAYLLPACN
jgi:hypothetical protein